MENFQFSFWASIKTTQTVPFCKNIINSGLAGNMEKWIEQHKILQNTICWEGSRSDLSKWQFVFFLLWIYQDYVSISVKIFVGVFFSLSCCRNILNWMKHWKQWKSHTNYCKTQYTLEIIQVVCPNGTGACSELDIMTKNAKKHDFWNSVTFKEYLQHNLKSFPPLFS